jgi:hypothetical protein
MPLVAEDVKGILERSFQTLCFFLATAPLFRCPVSSDGGGSSQCHLVFCGKSLPFLDLKPTSTEGGEVVIA